MDVESKRIHSRLEQLTPVISILARPRQDDCCEVETTLGFILSTRPTWATQPQKLKLRSPWDSSVDEGASCQSWYWSLPPGAHVVIGGNRLLQAGPLIPVCTLSHVHVGVCIHSKINKNGIKSVFKTERKIERKEKR